MIGLTVRDEKGGYLSGTSAAVEQNWWDHRISTTSSTKKYRFWILINFFLNFLKKDKLSKSKCAHVKQFMVRVRSEERNQA